MLWDKKLSWIDTNSLKRPRVCFLLLHIMFLITITKHKITMASPSDYRLPPFTTNEFHSKNDVPVSFKVQRVWESELQVYTDIDVASQSWRNVKKTVRQTSCCLLLLSFLLLLSKCQGGVRGARAVRHHLILKLPGLIAHNFQWIIAKQLTSNQTRID